MWVGGCVCTSACSELESRRSEGGVGGFKGHGWRETERPRFPGCCGKLQLYIDSTRRLMKKKKACASPLPPPPPPRRKRPLRRSCRSHHWVLGTRELDAAARFRDCLLLLTCFGQSAEPPPPPTPEHNPLGRLPCSRQATRSARRDGVDDDDGGVRTTWALTNPECRGVGVGIRGPWIRPSSPPAASVG